ncbi:MAG: phosphoglycerate dehydrogenase-like enzyme [Parasphingorhabdus sp.]|jgi:phosphoglycerate dehydrogenase-like enzyme
MSGFFNIVYPDADASSEAEIGAERLRQLESLGSYKSHIGAPEDESEFISRIENADGVMLGWSMSNAVMVAAPRLKVISFTGIGVAKFVDLDQAKRHGITVCNCPGYGDRTVAEHALALLFAVARKIPLHDQNTRRGSWSIAGEGFELLGRSVGLIGFGGIGQQFASLCQALGMRVLVWTRNPDKYRDLHPDYDFVDLQELLSTVDIVSLHVAHSAETEGLLGAAQISCMKDSAVVINTSRGEVIDEQALCDALQNGRLAGAGLDVFATEPLLCDHPLTSAPNTVLTPHIAYATPGASRRIHQIAADNILRYFAGDPINIV